MISLLIIILNVDIIAQPVWKNYTTVSTGSSGLIDNGVRCVCKAADGSYWFATDDGISILNGSEWTSYTSINNVPLEQSTFVYKDRQDNIWIAAGRDILLRSDGNNWITYRASDTTFTTYYIDQITDDKFNNLWFSSSFGISRFDGTNWTNYTNDSGFPPGSAISLASDSSGTIWAGTISWGAYKFDGTEWISSNNEDLIDHMVLTIYVDRSNNVWFGTYGNGFVKFDGLNWYHYTNVVNVTGIAQDSTGAYYFSSEYQYTGLYKFADNTWSHFNTTNSDIIGNNIYKMFQTGNLIWLIKYAPFGACYFDGNVFKTYSCDGLNDNYVYCVYEDKQHNYWFGTRQNNACMFDGSDWKSYRDPFEGGVTNTIQGNSVYSIIEDENSSLYFATDFYISKLCGDTWSLINSFPTNQIFRILKDEQSGLWFTHFKGITHYDFSSFTDYIFPDSLVFDEWGYGWAIPHLGYDMKQDMLDQIWMCDLYYGIRIYDGTSWQLNKSFKNARSICFDREGDPWIGTDSGVIHLHGSEMIRYTVENGLVNDTVNSILTDKSGNIWFGTNNGLSMIDSNLVWMTYSTSNGLVSNKINGIMEDSDKNLWFATDGGVSKLVLHSTGYPDHEPLQLVLYPNPCSTSITYNTTKPVFRIEIFNIDGHLLLVSGSEHNHGKIDISSLPDGLYIFKIYTKSGSVARRFIAM